VRVNHARLASRPGATRATILQSTCFQPLLAQQVDGVVRHQAIRSRQYATTSLRLAVRPALLEFVDRNVDRARHMTGGKFLVGRTSSTVTRPFFARCSSSAAGTVPSRPSREVKPHDAVDVGQIGLTGRTERVEQGNDLVTGEPVLTNCASLRPTIRPACLSFCRCWEVLATLRPSAWQVRPRCAHLRQQLQQVKPHRAGQRRAMRARFSKTSRLDSRWLTWISLQA